MPRESTGGLLFAVLLVALCLPCASSALTVYDGALGTLPAQQGWFGTGTGGSQSVGGGSLTLDTTANDAFQFGYARTDQALDTVGGYVLDVRAQIVSESHVSNDRAGFSIINIGSDRTRSIEIGFWDDRLWFQDAGFSRTTEITFAPGVFHDFRFRFQGGTLDVHIDGLQRATGLPLFDYGPAAAGIGFPWSLVYLTPNNFFFGDDTTSASADVRVESIALSAVPLPTPLAGMAAASLLLLRRRRR